MSGHISVMLEDVLAQLQPQAGQRIIDGTYGGGGYSNAILQSGAEVLAFDMDPTVIPLAHPNLKFVNANFAEMAAIAEQQGWTEVDGVVLDLGISSIQLDDPQRGIAHRFEGPLDMRLNLQGPTAADFLNGANEELIANVIYKYGEERHSRRIARAIVHDRLQTPWETTQQLAGMLTRVVPRSKTPGSRGEHPATRTFQALRIHINDELGVLETGLAAAINLLAPGGKLIVVNFHSLEDRIVKHLFRDLPVMPKKGEPPAGKLYQLLTKKPQLPSEAEIKNNSRARSAKLRAVQRIA